MKRIISLMSTVIKMALLMTIFLLISCKKESQPLNSDKLPDLSVSKGDDNSETGENRGPLKVDLVHIDMDVTVGTNQYLYNRTPPYLPVLAPDLHPVTLAEFHMVSGWADVKCINEGTHVVVHLKGLIPNGVYTLWVMKFLDPISSPPPGPNGVGALGAPDGSENVLTVNSLGTADLSVTMPAGNLSIFGLLPNCWGDVYKVMVAGAYHLDGQTHGASPGGTGGFSTYVLQFGFPVLGEKL